MATKNTAAKKNNNTAKKTAGGGSDKKGKKPKAKKPAGPTVWDVKAGKHTGTATSAVGVDGLTRTRFKWAGWGLCPLLKLVGYMGGTLDHARRLVASFQLDGTTSGSTISCQHSAGAQLAAGVSQEDCHHPGPVAELDKPTLAAFKKLCGM